MATIENSMEFLRLMMSPSGTSPTLFSGCEPHMLFMQATHLTTVKSQDMTMRSMRSGLPQLMPAAR
ncbi:hypothetical protein [Luteimonas sp. RIT-PG2_3]